jgi:hypothetical protein
MCAAILNKSHDRLPELDDAVRRRWPERGYDSQCPDAVCSTMSAHILSFVTWTCLLHLMPSVTSWRGQSHIGATWHQHYTVFYSQSAYRLLDSISSRFNVLNMPISTTAPIDAKTHVWPIDGIAQWLTNQRSPLGHIQAKTWDVFWLAAGY